MQCYPRCIRGTWYAVFECVGARFTATLRTKNETEATVRLGPIREALYRIETGTLDVPPGADVRAFVLAGGRESAAAAKVPRIPLEDLRARYLKSARNLESNSRDTTKIHLGHVARILGGKTLLSAVDAGAVEKYADARLKEDWRGRKIMGRTAAKELATLRTAMNWAARAGLISQKPAWTVGAVAMPKDRARERFRTYDEIEELLARRAAHKAPKGEDPWESLYLTDGEMRELLAFVAKAPAAPWVLPMFTFVAATGCRRSEMVRSLREDWDFDRMKVRIREKKKDRSREFTIREADVHPTLGGVMRSWFAAHPGGPWTITSDGVKPMRATTATSVLRATLDGHEKWCRIKGFHTLRHSVASILASKGVDPRVIDELLGHQTEEMRLRYQHLFPGKLRSAVHNIF